MQSYTKKNKKTICGHDKLTIFNDCFGTFARYRFDKNVVCYLKM